jgi:hypothetical protein
MSQPPSPWKKTSLTRNPYYRTAFRVARVPREIKRHHTVSMLISQTKQVVKTDPRAHSIQGQPVTEAELTEAEKILMDARARILEELIEHPAERLPLDHLKSLEAELRASIQPERELADLEVRMDFLKHWLPELIEQALAEQGSPDGLLGALELELVEPFGTVESR